jgi:hypothetical protein
VGVFVNKQEKVCKKNNFQKKILKKMGKIWGRVKNTK